MESPDRPKRFRTLKLVMGAHNSDFKDREEVVEGDASSADVITPKRKKAKRVVTSSDDSDFDGKHRLRKAKGDSESQDSEYNFQSSRSNRVRKSIIRHDQKDTLARSTRSIRQRSSDSRRTYDDIEINNAQVTGNSLSTRKISQILSPDRHSPRAAIPETADDATQEVVADEGPREILEKEPINSPDANDNDLFPLENVYTDDEMLTRRSSRIQTRKKETKKSRRYQLRNIHQKQQSLTYRTKSGRNVKFVSKGLVYHSSHSDSDNSSDPIGKHDYYEGSTNYSTRSRRIMPTDTTTVDSQFDIHTTSERELPVQSGTRRRVSFDTDDEHLELTEQPKRKTIKPTAANRVRSSSSDVEKNAVDNGSEFEEEEDVDEIDDFIIENDEDDEFNSRPKRSTRSSYSRRSVGNKNNGTTKGKGYGLRKKSEVDYSVYYMPKQKQLNAIEERVARSMGLANNRQRPSKYNSYHKSPRRAGGNKSSSDDERNQSTHLRGRNLDSQSSQQTRGNAPMNMLDLVIGQESALIKFLPEEERVKYQQDKTTFLGISRENQVVSTGFESIGGLDDHIRSLKEMVAMPLMYPEIFEKFRVTPPKGVLFHGPPGTGKTLMGISSHDESKHMKARALAASCSTSNQKVAFFVRKGADILSKWVGEAEKQLRELFDQAKAWQPSIIFFDEIDGLAPARSMSKQDHTHSSVVSTLLALMDGLDSRGQVVVIGATNRIDSIDPALRRPGRFDREFYFPLPDESARKKIIEMTTKEWLPPLDVKLIDYIGKVTNGYCGADVKALCTEAALGSIQRIYPQIYASTEKLAIDINNLQVTEQDLIKVLQNYTPSHHKSAISLSRSIPEHLLPLFNRPLEKLKHYINTYHPVLRKSGQKIIEPLGKSRIDDFCASIQCRLLISGMNDKAYKYLGPAVIEQLEREKFFVQSIDLATLLSDGMRSPETCLIAALQELRRHKPAVLYLPDIDEWFETISESAKVSLVQAVENNLPSHVLFFTTTLKPFSELPEYIQDMFTRNNTNIDSPLSGKITINCDHPSEGERSLFFEPIIQELVCPAPIPNKITFNTQSVELAVVIPEDTEPTDSDIEKMTSLSSLDEQKLRRLRHELRGVNDALRKDRVYKDFAKAVNVDQYPDYYDIVENPINLQDIYVKINDGEYFTPQDYIEDLELIYTNAVIYCGEDSDVVQKAKSLMDQALYMLGLLDADFVWECKQIALKRRVAKLFREKKREEARNNEVSDDDSNNEQPEDQEDCEMGVFDTNHAESIEDQVTSRIATDLVDQTMKEIHIELMTDTNFDCNQSTDEQIIKLFVEKDISATDIVTPSYNIDHELLTMFRRELVEKSSALNISQLEELSGLFYMILIENREELDRCVVLERLESVIVDL